MNKEQVIIRTYSAGVHYGTLVNKEKEEGGYHVTLENSRRIWKWAGANSLSELGTLGTSAPEDCNFSIPLRKIDLFAIEIIYMTDIAVKSIDGVKMWVFSKDNKKIEEALASF